MFTNIRESVIWGWKLLIYHWNISFQHGKTNEGLRFLLFQNKAWNFRFQQIPLEEAPLDFTYLQKYLPSSIQVLHVRDGCVTYHLIALGWLEAMISVSLLSKALRSSQATCSRLDMPLLTLRQIGRVVLPEKRIGCFYCNTGSQEHAAFTCSPSLITYLHM